jgi:hypothetical protein
LPADVGQELAVAQSVHQVGGWVGGEEEVAGSAKGGEGGGRGCGWVGTGACCEHCSKCVDVACVVRRACLNREGLCGCVEL